MGLWNILKRGRKPRGDGGFVPALKPTEAVARRFAIVVLVSELAEGALIEAAGAKREEGLAKRKHALDRLLAIGLSPADLEPAELELGSGSKRGQVEPGLVTSALWRLEGAPVLAWALGLTGSIPSADLGANVAELDRLIPPDRTAFEQLAATASMRPLNAAMAAYHEWSMRFFEVEPQQPTERRSRILERSRSLRWLVEPDQRELSSVVMLGTQR
jgi:hypothetical protein